MYAPGSDPNNVDLNTPTDAFDACGSYMYGADGVTKTKKDFAS